MKNIASAFIKAKQAFGPALKAKNNPAFKGSKYADLAACLDAVDDALLNNGIALYQETSLDETGVTVETVFLHESGEVIKAGKLHVPASKQDPQGYGSALSYARRYSLMAACGIAAEDDDGNAASGRAPKPVAVDIAPWIAKMNEAKSSKELATIALEGWNATGDERVTAHQSKLLKERLEAKAKADAYAAQQGAAA